LPGHFTYKAHRLCGQMMAFVCCRVITKVRAMRPDIENKSNEIRRVIALLRRHL
jgi:hypothetical protein